MFDNTELLRYEVWHFQGPYGGRVFEDGRYESYSGLISDQEPMWKAQSSLTAERMAEVKAAVDTIMGSGLSKNIRRLGSIPPDSARATFTLRGKQYVIDNYSSEAPVEFTQLVERITRLNP